MKAITITLALLGIAAAAQADLRSQILKGEAAYSKAMKTNDMAAFERLMRRDSTSDFKYTEGGQSMDMKKMVEMMKMGMSQMKKVTKASSELLSLKESSKTATAKTRRSMGGIVVGQDKKSHTMTFTGDSTDTYVKVGGKWKLSSMVWGKTVQTMDGKVIPPGQM